MVELSYIGRKVGNTEEPASEEERIERSKGLVFEDAVPVREPSGIPTPLPNDTYNSRPFSLLLAIVWVYHRVCGLASEQG
jgi:hypothetical protein